jgi:hypothetical protein
VEGGRATLTTLCLGGAVRRLLVVDVLTASEKEILARFATRPISGAPSVIKGFTAAGTLGLRGIVQILLGISVNLPLLVTAVSGVAGRKHPTVSAAGLKIVVAGRTIRASSTVLTVFYRLAMLVPIGNSLVKVTVRKGSSGGAGHLPTQSPRSHQQSNRLAVGLSHRPDQQIRSLYHHLRIQSSPRGLAPQGGFLRGTSRRKTRTHPLNSKIGDQYTVGFGSNHPLSSRDAL